MVSGTPEEYSCLQVERPIVSGSAEFLGKVAHIALKVFGEEPITSVSETRIHTEERDDGSIELGELETRAVTIHTPRSIIYSPDDLRLVLLRKYVPVEMSSKYNFNHKVFLFNQDNRGPVQKRRGKTQRQKETIREAIDTISTDHDVPALNTPIHFDRIQDIFDLGGQKELALLPSVGKPASTVVLKQAVACSDKLVEISPSAMNPQGPEIPFVPFMRLPLDVTDRKLEQFMDEVNSQPTLLPVRLVMGGVRAKNGDRRV